MALELYERIKILGSRDQGKGGGGEFRGSEYLVKYIAVCGDN